MWWGHKFYHIHQLLQTNKQTKQCTRAVDSRYTLRLQTSDK